MCVCTRERQRERGGREGGKEGEREGGRERRREKVVRRIACNNVRYTHLTSLRYVEFCSPLGDVREPDTLNLSARLKKSIP